MNEQYYYETMMNAIAEPVAFSRRKAINFIDNEKGIEACVLLEKAYALLKQAIYEKMENYTADGFNKKPKYEGANIYSSQFDQDPIKKSVP